LTTSPIQPLSEKEAELLKNHELERTREQRQLEREEKFRKFNDILNEHVDFNIPEEVGKLTFPKFSRLGLLGDTVELAVLGITNSVLRTLNITQFSTTILNDHSNLEKFLKRYSSLDKKTEEILELNGDDTEDTRLKIANAIQDYYFEEPGPEDFSKFSFILKFYSKTDVQRKSLIDAFWNTKSWSEFF
jgi:hypothetical protein